MPMKLYDRSGGTTVVGKCARIVSALKRRARDRLLAIRHRFDGLAYRPDRAVRSGSLMGNRGCHDINPAMRTDSSV
jgi:hypothetical protein